MMVILRERIITVNMIGHKLRAVIGRKENAEFFIADKKMPTFS